MAPIRVWLPLGRYVSRSRPATGHGSALGRLHSGSLTIGPGQRADVLVAVSPACAPRDIAAVLVEGLGTEAPVRLEATVLEYEVPPGLSPRDDPRE